LARATTARPLQDGVAIGRIETLLLLALLRNMVLQELAILVFGLVDWMDYRWPILEIDLISFGDPGSLLNGFS
jgi:hypothetical protein